MLERSTPENAAVEALKVKTGRKLRGRLAVIQAIEGGLLVYPQNTHAIKLLYLKKSPVRTKILLSQMSHPVRSDLGGWNARL